LYAQLGKDVVIAEQVLLAQPTAAGPAHSRGVEHIFP